MVGVGSTCGALEVVRCICVGGRCVRMRSERCRSITCTTTRVADETTFHSTSPHLLGGDTASRKVSGQGELGRR